MKNGDEMSKFAAREYVAHIERELGAKLPEEVAKQTRIAYETGYLRGRSDALKEALSMTIDLGET